MTNDEFNSVRLSLLTFSSDMCWKMCKKITLDQNWTNDFYKLYALNRMIDIYLEYNPSWPEGENFFSVTDMLFIQEKTNMLLSTNYTLNFILE